MFRSIAALLSAALLLAAPAAVAQSSQPTPVVAAGPAPAVPWCPPGQTKTAAGTCVAAAPAPAAKPAPTVYQTVGGVRTAVAGPGAALAKSQTPVLSAKPPTPVLSAKPVAAPPTTYAKPPAAAPAIAASPIPAAKPLTIAVGEPNGDCTTRAPNLIHDSRSPSGCAPCPGGRVPNADRQACVIPIPRRY
ncbi:hypothetical protein JKL49_18585 [Phenylobacterium sp. 20VBR1]|uniref:Fe-S oxidoreductase n=1 Tax=Phenylobacterium glaciei TaxID=2803784 RepID=A0A941HYH7_9CAUL|nr:hypothetical protein [Phenylobacterium glaciei]MBR7621407.1 hypothetical protein [Phenylobacterium glaciei]